MSVTSATDPVQTVIDLLDNEAGNWSNSHGTPDRIDRSEEHEPSEKMRDARRVDVSMYVWSFSPGGLRKLAASGDDADRTEVARVEVWTDGASKTGEYASDVEAFLAQYAVDNEQQTNWFEIWPAEEDDQTAQAFWRSSFAVMFVDARLRRVDTL